MQRILHIIKEGSDSEKVLALLEKQAMNPHVEPFLLLIQKAALISLTYPIKTFTLTNGGNTEPKSALPQNPISFKEMLELIFSSDSVIVW